MIREKEKIKEDKVSDEEETDSEKRKG